MRLNTSLPESLTSIKRLEDLLPLGGLHTGAVIIDEDERPLGDAWIEMMGLPETGRAGRPLAEEMERELGEFLEKAPPKVLADDEKLEEAIKRIVRQVATEDIGKKPEVLVVISRLVAE